MIVGDMASTRAPGVYTLVYLVYNAISCLLTQSPSHVSVYRLLAAS